MANHLFDAVLGARRDDPRPFLKLPDGRALSYAGTYALAARWAEALRAAGLEPGDRVAAQVEKSAEAFALYLGCLGAGGAFLPLNPAYTSSEMAYFIADAEPRVVLADPAKRAGLEAPSAAVGATLATLDAVGRSPMLDGAPDASEATRAFAPAERGPDDLAGILYTSGTTGRAKGAMQTHDNLLSNGRTLAELWRFTAEDTLLHALPIFHTHGLFIACHPVALSGASMLFQPKFDRDAILTGMSEASVMMGVPTFYTRLLDDPRFDRARAAHMRLFISGSAPLLAETHRAFEARAGSRILERYGMTETTIIASNPYEGERRPGSVGPAIPGVSLRISDPESGAPTPLGEVGVIEVRGPNVFKGYWRMPERTAEEFRDGFFVTGDLGTLDAEGYVTIVGRAKDLIISGGFNVYPKEVEAVIDALPGVREAAVIGAPHRDFGEAVVAVVAAEPGARLTAEAVSAGLRDALARFKQPKKVFIVEALPRNAMGKVQKKALRETYADVFQG